MKLRILSSVAALALLFLNLIFINTLLVIVTVAALSVVAVFELHTAMKTLYNRPLFFLDCFFAALLPFLTLGKATLLIPTACVLYLIFYFLILLFQHSTEKFNRNFVTLFTVLFYALSFSTAILLRDLYKLSDFDYVKEDGIFFIILCATGAWISDTGAFFSGLLFGKHKLSPTISPKKTIEGALGGIVFCSAGFVLAGYLYQIFASVKVESVSYLSLLIIGFFASVVSIIGDLFASYIKRANDIKDFGKIMPGHGGVLDRFDSFLLVSPFLLTVLQYVEIINRSIGE